MSFSQEAKTRVCVKSQFLLYMHVAAKPNWIETKFHKTTMPIVKTVLRPRQFNKPNSYLHFCIYIPTDVPQALYIPSFLLNIESCE